MKKLLFFFHGYIEPKTTPKSKNVNLEKENEHVFDLFTKVALDVDLGYSFDHYKQLNGRKEHNSHGRFKCAAV